MVKLKDKFKNKPTGLISSSDFKTVSGNIYFIYGYIAHSLHNIGSSGSVDFAYRI